jgi:RNA polymerase sigma-70 factor (ECF subfamily)
MKTLMIDQNATRNLVDRARNGEREAFDLLASAFGPRLRLSIQGWSKFQLGPKADADDVLQETFVRAYRGLPRFEWQDEDSFFRWLCGIAKHALAQAAQDARRVGQSVTSDPVQKSGASATRVLRRHERFDRLEAALERLPPDHQQIIRLCRLDGLTSTEAGERMNRSPAAVRQLLVRALRELKEHFGDTESLHLPDRQFRFREKNDDQ